MLRVLNPKHVTRCLRATGLLTVRGTWKQFMRKSPDIQIEEIEGDQFPDLESALQHVWKTAAPDIAEDIRRLLAEGLFVIVDGKIIPNPERE